MSEKRIRLIGFIVLSMLLTSCTQIQSIPGLWNKPSPNLVDLNITPYYENTSVTLPPPPVFSPKIVFFVTETSKPVLVNYNQSYVLINPGKDISVIGKVKDYTENLTAVIVTNPGSTDPIIIRYLQVKFSPKKIYVQPLLDTGLENITKVFNREVLIYDGFSVVLYPTYSEGYIEPIDQNIIITQVVLSDKIITLMDTCGAVCEKRVKNFLSSKYIVASQNTSIDLLINFGATTIYDYGYGLNFKSIGVETVNINDGMVVE